MLICLSEVDLNVGSSLKHFMFFYVVFITFEDVTLIVLDLAAALVTPETLKRCFVDSNTFTHNPHLHSGE